MLPARPLARVPSVPGGCQRLEDADWYWGTVSKEKVSEAMSGAPDGTYLVRNAASKGREDGYTLTVRKGGHSKLLRINCRDGKFGFTDRCQFHSVIELVEYFQRHSLAVFNKALDVKLMHPLSELTLQEEVPSGDMSAKERWFISAHIDYLTKKEECDRLHDRLTFISQDLQEKHLYVSAFKETLSMLDEQISTGAENQKHVTKRDLPTARENLAMVKSRRALASQMETQLEEETGQLTQQMRAIMQDLNSANRALGLAQRKREDLKQQLLNDGESENRIALLVDGSNQWLSEGRPTSLPQLLADLELSALPHLREATWLDPTCTRDMAERKLIGRPEGTFLIRQRGDGGRDGYVLSIVCHIESPDGAVSYVTVRGERVQRRGTMRVCHCLIDRTTTGYGFAEPYYIHETLTDLVMHYRVTSLVEHNDRMDVMLKYPIYASSPSSPPPAAAAGRTAAAAAAVLAAAAAPAAPTAAPPAAAGRAAPAATKPRRN